MLSWQLLSMPGKCRCRVLLGDCKTRDKTAVVLHGSGILCKNILTDILSSLNHERWREALSSSSPGPLLMMQALVIKMPEIAKVRPS